MTNRPFVLKTFSVCQNSAPMKVNTDALVLGAWLDGLSLTNCNYILDVGTGTGIIALMLAQAYPSSAIHGIDIDTRAVAEAANNFAHSPYAERLTALSADVLRYRPNHLYDLIVSNPPYFSLNTVTSLDDRRRRARTESEDGLDLGRLMATARTLLKPSGYIALITPVEREDDLRSIATLNCLRLVAKLTVHSLPGVPVRIASLWQPIEQGGKLQRTCLSSICITRQSQERHVLYREALREYLM